MNGDEEFMPFLTCDATIMPQEGGRVSLDGGQGTAQFVAHGCEQFCLQQLHTIERLAVSNSLEFMDAVDQQHIHDDGVHGIHHKRQPSVLKYGDLCIIASSGPTTKQESLHKVYGMV